LELNGFLLGQHREAIERALGVPFQVDSHPDGWVDRIYLIARDRNAYMAFKFPDRRHNYAYSVQVAGQLGTPMHPFLGLVLGAPRSEVLRRLGPPTTSTPERELHLELLEYSTRNYSVEIDSAGRLSSIQIYGYAGLPERADTAGPEPIDRFRNALAASNIDSVLAVVAPDIEIYRAGSTITFAKAPRTELADSTSPLTRAILTDPASIRAAIRARPTDSAVRVQENGIVGLVYKYDAGAVRELLFVYVPGGYRLWEATFR
jgi:hypothetical protein